MKNLMNGPSCTNSPATPTETAQVCGLRSLIMELLLASPFATDQEWETAAQRVYNNSNLATLAKWYRNTVRELASREDAAPAPVVYATGSQKEAIIRLLNHPAITRRHKTRVLVGINRLTSADAHNEIARLTAYTATPFGGGPVVDAAGVLVGFSDAAPDTDAALAAAVLSGERPANPITQFTYTISTGEVDTLDVPAAIQQPLMKAFVELISKLLGDLDASNGGEGPNA